MKMNKIRIRDTLTLDDKEQLLSRGTPVGLFLTMIESVDPFYKYVYPMCLEYYMVRSWNKQVSPTYYQWLEIMSQIYESEGSPSPGKDKIIALANSKIGGNVIRPKFIDKWSRLYRALIDEQYSIIDDYSDNSETTESRTNTTKYNTMVTRGSDNTSSITHDINTKTSGNNSDTTTYNTEVEDNGKFGRRETVTHNNTSSNDVYGFNSVSPVGNNYDTENRQEITESSPENNTNINTETKTGTEETARTVSENVAKTGTETTKNNTNETEGKTGSDSNTVTVTELKTNSGRRMTGAEILQRELDFRNQNIFFDIVFRDIDSIVTLAIY